MFKLVTTATSSQLEKIPGQPKYEGWRLDHKAQRTKTRDWISALNWYYALVFYFILCGWRGERKRKMNKIHAERLTLTHCLGPNLAYLANLLLTSLFIFSLRNYESDQCC